MKTTRLLATILLSFFHLLSTLVLNAGLFGATFNTAYRMPVRLSVMLPFHQRTLSDEGDALNPGQTVSLTMSRAF